VTSRPLASLAILAALALAACGSDDSSSSSSASATPAADACAKDQLALKTPGTLTIGTDKPAYPPYFEDDKP
jgi:polar amino acid transport system substrate-binding protein